MNQTSTAIIQDIFSGFVTLWNNAMGPIFELVLGIGLLLFGLYIGIMWISKAPFKVTRK